jgi:hypothetical protein
MDFILGLVAGVIIGWYVSPAKMKAFYDKLVAMIKG